MKKLLLLNAILAMAYANIPNSDINNSDDNETKIFNEEVKNLSSQEELNHLFENSKFPVDDYIYKAGFKKPDNKAIVIKEEPKEEPKEETKTDLNKIKERLEQNQINMARDDKEKEKAKYKKMLRDELLANRTSGIKDFSNESKYGVDGFSNQKSIDIATNEHKLTRMIRAGRLIPALLTTAISSDVSGIITAE